MGDMLTRGGRLLRVQIHMHAAVQKVNTFSALQHKQNNPQNQAALRSFT
jgi:hypothetical protein